MSTKTSSSEPGIMRYRTILICLCLALVTLAVYWQVRNHEFLNFDDNEYVTENRHVQTGLTMESIGWAFTSTHMFNWHPVTWLSHMLDSQIHGMIPGRHHMTSVFLHIVNTLLLFLVLMRISDKVWRSAFVAALFALHPLHVESVAWVAERKDVLSTFFWMLTLWCYVRYVERPGVRRYLPVVLFFALGLMAKPMLVTLPFVLLLLDYWPLGRFQCGGGGMRLRSSDLRLIREKVPLFLLAGASSIVTFLIMRHGGVVVPLRDSSFGMRVANTLVAYASYLGKMVWPFSLAVFYPHPGPRPAWQVAAACFVLGAISAVAIKTVRRSPSLLVGWLWYLGTLVPVIGLVQVGSHVMADRYTYVPLIGIFLMIAWGIPQLAPQSRRSQRGLGLAAMVTLLVLSGTTWIQVRYWNNSIALLEHALDVTGNNNFVAHNNLSSAYLLKDDPHRALEHALRASEIEPQISDPLIQGAEAAARTGRPDQARSLLQRALSLDPRNAKAHNNMGNVAYTEGDLDQAVAWWKKALELDPSNVNVLYNLGLGYQKLGHHEWAAFYYGRFADEAPAGMDTMREEARKRAAMLTGAKS